MSSSAEKPLIARTLIDEGWLPPSWPAILLIDSSVQERACSVSAWSSGVTMGLAVHWLAATSWTARTSESDLPDRRLFHRHSRAR